MTAISEHERRTSDGLRQFYRRWAPGGRSHGHLVIVHGSGEHSGRYDHVGRYFAAKGYTTWAPDLRGLGRSEGTRGHIGDFRTYAADVAGFCRFVAGGTEDPVGIWGHSMGGLVTLMTLLEHKDLELTSCTLTAPLLELSLEVPLVKALAGRILAGTIPKLRLGGEIDPGLLSSIPEVGRKQRDDPLSYDKVSAAWFVAMQHARREAMSRAGELTLPLQLMHSEDDGICSVQGSKRLSWRAGSDEVELVLVRDRQHELHNEVDAEDHLDTILNWFDSHRPAQG